MKCFLFTCQFPSPDKRLLLHVAQVLKALAGPFYYRQNCQLAVTAVYHPDDEHELVLSLKRGVTSALSHQIRPDQEQVPYQVLEEGAAGLKTMRYRQDGRAYHKSSLLMQSVPSETTAETEDAGLSKEGFAHVTVASVHAGDGRVDQFTERQTGGFLSQVPANTIRAMQMLLQAEPDLVNQGAGSPSVQAQTAASGVTTLNHDNNASDVGTENFQEEVFL